MTQRPRELCVVVDDFGMSQGVNLAALSLADVGQISAIGCMVRRAAWSRGARAARQLDPLAIDLGLHLDLNTPHRIGLAEKSLSKLIGRSYAGMWNVRRLQGEIDAQLTRFEDAIGRAPVFVDGHCHVHQLPMVRECLVAALVQRYGNALPWLRNTAPPTRGWTKADLIHALGGKALSRLALRHGIPMNRALLGVYDFSPSCDYGARLRTWRSQCAPLDVLMCHPSMGTTNDVPHAVARWHEYTALRDFDWSSTTDGGPVRIAPLSRLVQRRGADASRAADASRPI